MTKPNDDKERREQRRARRRGDALARGERRDGLPAALAMTPQKLYHWNRNDQLDALIEARDAEPNTGFMMRLLALCALPRTNPGERFQYVRHNGPFALIMSATSHPPRLPYGTLPRLLLAWVCTEAVRTQSRTLVLGRSLAGFMRTLGITDDSGGSRGDRTRVRNQMDRLFSAHVSLIHEDQHGKQFVSSVIADRGEFWWDPRGDQPVLWDSTIRLGEEFFNEIIVCPIPLDLGILKAMKRSSLGLDLYMWLTYRLFGLNAPLRLTWPQLYRQFSVNPSQANVHSVNNFRTAFLYELQKLKIAWPQLAYSTPRGCLELRQTPPRIAPRPSTDSV